ncbi:MAG: aminotransferase class IV [Bacteroidales bacterium]|nr:aminotransferase class IV [Bacteroidales bacterium]
MSEITGSFFIHDRQLKRIELFSEFYKTHGIALYEVIRIMDGIPVFYSDHIERLNKSALLANCKLFLSNQEIETEVLRLIQVNTISNGNIKIVFNYPPKEARIPGIFQVFFVKSNYPISQQYNMGVKTITMNVIRDNPNAKVFNHIVRSETTKRIVGDVYEVVLTNEQGLITEGSMSNLFFIKEDQVFTAPLYLVLGGITRKYIIDCCRRLLLNVIEQAVDMNDLQLYDAVFLSGTSPKVLPVSSINKNNFDVKNKILQLIMKEYDDLLQKEIGPDHKF